MKAKLAQIVFLLFLFFSFFAKSTFAALTITGFSTDTINSGDDVLIINASASGLQNSTQYLEVAFTKDGESSNYFGLTLNSSNEWYQYKSSPSTADLSSYFYTFTSVNGAWSGQIQARVDINDSGFKGPGKYNFKLLKFITSSSTSSNVLSINVNISPTPTDTPTPTLTNAPTSTNIPIPTKTLTPKSSLTPTIKLSSKLTPTISVKTDQASTSGVLGKNIQSLPKNPEKADKEAPKTEVFSLQNKPLFPIIFIFIGVIFLILCVIVIFYPFLKKLKEEKFNG